MELEASAKVNNDVGAIYVINRLNDLELKDVLETGENEGTVRRKRTYGSGVPLRSSFNRPTPVRAVKEVELVDSNTWDGLRLFHYSGSSACTSSDPDGYKLQRGVICNSEGYAVCKSFGYVPDYTPERVDEIKREMGNVPFESFKFFELEEGCILRLYYHDPGVIQKSNYKLNPEDNLLNYVQLSGSEAAVPEVVVTESLPLPPSPPSGNSISGSTTAPTTPVNALPVVTPSGNRSASHLEGDSKPNGNNKLCGGWFLSTHHKINAFESYWGISDSFGKEFLLALRRCLVNELSENETAGRATLPRGRPTATFNLFCETLSKNKVYTFLLRNNRYNRLISDPSPVPKLYFTGSFTRPDFTYSLTDPDIKLRSTTERTFGSLQGALDYVNTIPYQSKKGLLMYSPSASPQRVESGGIFINIFSSDYSKLAEIRGSQPSIKYRYLQIRTDEAMNKSLRELYPEMKAKFDRYEDTLSEVARGLYEAYHQRYTEGQWITVPKKEYRVMSRVRDWSVRTREEVTHKTVLDFLNTEDSSVLNEFINRHVYGSPYQNTFYYDTRRR